MEKMRSIVRGAESSALAVQHAKKLKKTYSIVKKGVGSSLKDTASRIGFNQIAEKALSTQANQPKI